MKMAHLDEKAADKKKKRKKNKKNKKNKNTGGPWQNLRACRLGANGPSAWWLLVLLLPFLFLVLLIEHHSDRSHPFGEQAESATASDLTTRETSDSPNSKYLLRVNSVNILTHSNVDYSWAYFALPSSGSALVNITLPADNSPGFSSLSVSPLHITIPSTVSSSSQRTAWASLPGPGYYIATFAANNDSANQHHHPLILIAETTDSAESIPSGPNTFTLAAPSNGTDLVATTSAFQSAISGAAASRASLVVPAGRYLLGNLQLPSHTRLHLAAGAHLLYSGDASDYRQHWYKASQRAPVTWWLATVPGSTNISLSGPGILDGNNQAAYAGRMLNNLLVPLNTSDFTLSGWLLLNSASWALTPILSTNVTLRNIKTLNRFSNAGENDGIDVMHCSYVRVEHALGVGLDDPFSTKTWARYSPDSDSSSNSSNKNSSEHGITSNWPLPPPSPSSSLPLPPNTDIRFRDLLSWTLCFGIKIGAGVEATQRDITFSNVTVYSAAIAIGINHEIGDATAEGVTFEDVVVEKVRGRLLGFGTWFLILVSGGSGSGGETQQRRAMVEDVVVRRVTVGEVGVSGRAVVRGYGRERIVSGVAFERIWVPDGEGGGRLATGKEELGIMETGGREGSRWVENVTVTT